MGYKCPKCGYERQSGDLAPEYECPKCGVIYSKYATSQSYSEEKSGNDRIKTGSGTSQAKKGAHSPIEITYKKYRISLGVYKVLFLSVLTVAIVSILTFLAITFVLRGNEDISVSFSSSDNISEQFDNTFGWGRAKEVLEIDAVDIKKGKRIWGYSDYKHPTPAISLRIKNNSDKKVSSFGIVYSFYDIDNKIELGSYGEASGSIDPGWSSEIKIFRLGHEDWLDIMNGNKPIDFRVLVQISYKAKKEDILLYETVFEPGELARLPELKG